MGSNHLRSELSAAAAADRAPFERATASQRSVRTFEPGGVDGIVGFAYQSISVIRAPTVFESFVSAGEISNLFSMCVGMEGGAMTLGGIGPYYTGSFQYTPIIAETYYVVYMSDLRVEGSSVGLSSSIYNSGSTGTVVDSGTTDMIIPSTAFSALKVAMQNLCSSQFILGVCETQQTIFDGYCYSLTAAQLSTYPTIQVVLGQTSPITLSVPPTAYMVQGRCQDSSFYALAIDSISDGEGTILGDVFMMNFMTVFDVENSQLGFAQASNCPSHAGGSPSTNNGGGQTSTANTALLCSSPSYIVPLLLLLFSYILLYI